MSAARTRLLRRVRACVLCRGRPPVWSEGACPECLGCGQHVPLAVRALVAGLRGELGEAHGQLARLAEVVGQRDSARAAVRKLSADLLASDKALEVAIAERDDALGRMDTSAAGWLEEAFDATYPTARRWDEDARAYLGLPAAGEAPR